MKVFFGGQIWKDYRGNLAVVVSHPKDNLTDYSIFLEEPFSGDFNHLTGLIRVQDFPLDRVYIGINQEGSQLLTAEEDNLRNERTTLDNLDKIVVIPYFLRKEVSVKT